MYQRNAIVVHVTASMARTTKSTGGWEPAPISKASLLENVGPPRGKLGMSSGERIRELEGIVGSGRCATENDLPGQPVDTVTGV